MKHLIFRCNQILKPGSVKISSCCNRIFHLHCAASLMADKSALSCKCLEQTDSMRDGILDEATTEPIDRAALPTMRRDHREMCMFIDRTSAEMLNLDPGISIEIMREDCNEERDEPPMVQNGNGHNQNTDRAVRRALKSILIRYARMPLNITNTIQGRN